MDGLVEFKMSDSDDIVLVGHTSSESHDSDFEARNEISLEVIGDDVHQSTESEQDELTREREDIVQAQQAVDRVKEAIQFHDDETLQQALEKVKERPLIDSEFSTKIEMLQRIKGNGNYADFHNVVDEALAMLTGVQQQAKNGKTTLSRPIEVLNEVLPVFDKACSVFTEKVELSLTVDKNLIQVDKYRAMIKDCLLLDRQDVEEAKRLEKNCEKTLDEAVKSSKEDVKRVENKIKEEEEANILKWFKDTRESTNDRMDYLTADFEQMKDNCVEDIQLTERTLQIEIESKENAYEKFKKKDEELHDRIQEDLDQEEELKERLRKVQEHRKTLEEEKEIRKAKQDKANVVHQKAEEELQLLLENLSNLRTKLDTANIVLKQTKDVCNMLFNKAVESKSMKNRDLEDVLIQGKMLEHTALVAQAVNYKHNAESQKGTVTYLSEKIAKRKHKLQDALQRKLSKEVKEHQEKLKNLTSDYDGSKKLLQKSQDKLDGLLTEISALETELDRADMQYEKMDDAYERFKKQEEGDDTNSMLPSYS